MAYAGYADEYLESRDPRADLVVLGSTSGDPKIWFASIPEACAAPPSPALGCLVFFRPSGTTYDRIDQIHDMFGLNRYLLKAVEDPEAAHWKRDKLSLNPETGAPWLWIRCGFEDALVRSGKAVVMLHPWPSALKYGSATSSALPSLAEAAIRLLWAEQRVGKERLGIHLGRLGLAGFSAGGLPLFEALAQNRKRVDEVYAFDARGVAERTAALAAWMNERPSACLRMTGGHQIEANAAVLKALARSPRASELMARVTAVPESAAAYEQPGATPHWDYALEEFPGHRAEPDARHQFAIFGGFDAQPGPFAITSLQRFLQDSLF
jgi:dienelactone hydrolase